MRLTSTVKNKLLGTLLAIAFGFGTATPATADPDYFGKFSGNPTLTFDGDGTHAILVGNFSFMDEKNRLWLVPTGYKTDGASIPQIFWSIIGAPLTGTFRNAAIIHDYFCDRRAHSWQEVHQVFYKGMRAAGVSPQKAWVMYKAVYQFGPRWEKKIDIPKECQAGPDFSAADCVINSEPKIEVYRNPVTPETFAAFVKAIRSDGFGSEADEMEAKIRF